MTDDDSGPLMKQHSVWLGVKLPIADTTEGKHCLSLCYQDVACSVFCVYSATLYGLVIIAWLPLPGNDDDNETPPAKKHSLPVAKGTSAQSATKSVNSALTSYFIMS